MKKKLLIWKKANKKHAMKLNMLKSKLYKWKKGKIVTNFIVFLSILLFYNTYHISKNKLHLFILDNYYVKFILF